MFDSSWLLVALAWILTYAVHSTVFLGLAWWISRRLGPERQRLKEVVWRSALVGGLLAATLQVGFNLDPVGGRLDLAALAGGEPATGAAAAQEPASTRPPPPGASSAARRPAGEPDPALVRALLAQREEQRAAVSSRPGAGDPLPGPQIDRRGALQLVLSRVPTWQTVLMCAWGLGGLAGLVLLATSWARLREYLGGREKIRRGSLPALFHDLCRRAGVKRTPRLTSSPRLHSPVTHGVLRREITLPVRALTDLGPAQQEAMLAHELAHAVRLDPLWRWLYRIAEVLFFFQPLHRVARRELEENAELLCDDWAVRTTGRGLSLARCLTEVAAWLTGQPEALPAPTMASRGRGLSLRVERLLDRDRSYAEQRRPRCCLPLAAACLGLVAWAVPGASANPSGATGAAADAVPPATAHRQPDRAPDLAPPTAATPPEPANPAAALGQLVELVDHELHLLGTEIALLERELDGVDLTPALAQNLGEVDRRMRELRERRERLHALLPAVEALYGEPPPASDPDPLPHRGPLGQE